MIDTLDQLDLDSCMTVLYSTLAFAVMVGALVGVAVVLLTSAARGGTPQ